MTALSKSALQTKIDTMITTNGVGAITGAQMNEILKDIADSYVNLISSITTIGIVEYDPARTYIAGVAALYNGTIVQALVETTGTYDSADWRVIYDGNKEVSVADIAARNAYNITSLPTNVFVIDDGDTRWALYRATTTGVGATFVKISDPDLLNAVMTAGAIKTAYESNADTNCFTDALLTKLNAISGTNTGDETNGTILAKVGYTPENTANKAVDFSVINDTKFPTVQATETRINAAIAALVDSSPAALDTLNELAAALGDDANFATTVTNALALKAAIASPTFTGVPASPTAAPGTNTTQVATTAFVTAAVAAVSSPFTDAGAYVYLTTTTDLFQVGSSTSLGASLGVKGQGSTSGTTNQANYASDGTLLYRLTDSGQALYGTALSAVWTTHKLNVIGTSSQRGIYTHNATSTSYSDITVGSNRDDATNYARLILGGSAASSPSTDLYGLPIADLTILEANGANSQGLLIGVGVNKSIKFATNSIVRNTITGGGQTIIGGSTLPTVFSASKLNVIGSTAHRGIYTRNVDNTSYSEMLIESNRDDASNYARIILGGSAAASPATDLYGLAIADLTIFEVTGANSQGMVLAVGAAKPIKFATNGTVKTQITSAGSLVHGTAALATNATDGFLYIPTCAGTPTGSPTTQTGTVPMIWDSTNKKFYIYDGGWLGGTAPGVFS